MKESSLFLPDVQLCCGCMACFSICPKKAISLVEDNRGFEYPCIDIDKCVHCHMCERVCPIK